MRAFELEYLTLTYILSAKHLGIVNQARFKMTQDDVPELYDTDSTT